MGGSNWRKGARAERNYFRAKAAQGKAGKNEKARLSQLENSTRSGGRGVPKSRMKQTPKTGGARAGGVKRGATKPSRLRPTAKTRGVSSAGGGRRKPVAAGRKSAVRRRMGR